MQQVRLGPLAIRSGAFRGLRPLMLPIVVVAVLDMALSTFLTAWGEQHVSSWRHDGLICLVSADPPLTTVQLIAVADRATGR